MKRYLPFIIIFLVLAADQSLKFWVKTHMYAGQEINIIDHWFKLHFLENEGMAFGMAYGGNSGKIFLTLFRIAALVVIGYFLWRSVVRNAPAGLIICFSLIFAGAMGNIIDSVFYGVLFEGSDIFHPNIARFLSPGGGYAPLLQGKVVDMLYFPLIKDVYPDWIPFLGGKPFIFFRPVFNLADASITTGVAAVLIFYRRYFGKHAETEPEVPSKVAD